MTVDPELKGVLDALLPTLEGAGRSLCISVEGRLAVIVLDDPVHIARDELALALALHDHLDASLLVVL